MSVSISYPFVPREALVIVKSAQDLINIDSTKTYHIDGVVDMDTQSMSCPNRVSMGGLNASEEVTRIVTSVVNLSMFEISVPNTEIILENITLEVNGAGASIFKTTGTGSLKRIKATNCTFIYSGVGSKLFNNVLANQDGYDFYNCNFINGTSFGEVTNGRQIFFSGCGFIAIQDGITLNGSWSGFRAADSITLSFTPYTFLKKRHQFNI